MFVLLKCFKINCVTIGENRSCRPRNWCFGFPEHLNHVIACLQCWSEWSARWWLYFALINVHFTAELKTFFGCLGQTALKLCTLLILCILMCLLPIYQKSADYSCWCKLSCWIKDKLLQRSLRPTYYDVNRGRRGWFWMINNNTNYTKIHFP